MANLRTTSRRGRSRDILLLLWKGGASGRDFLFGFMAYARTKPAWHVHIRHAADFSHEEMRRVVADGNFDAIVTGERAFDVFPELTGNPATQVVIFGTYVERPDLPNLHYVQNDNAAIGRFAAQSLLAMGAFQSYGFVPTNCSRSWTRQRARAFVDALAARGVSGRVFSGQSDGELSDWLTALPKPAAVMAACDTRALEVLDCASRATINVPSQLVLLGVDNDELVCELARPMLSSILPRHDESGRLAACVLNRLFTGHPPKGPHVTFCAEQTLVERETTAHVAPVAHLIAKALSFINRQAHKGITVTDVVRHLGVSRSLADLRFREFYGQSIGETILARRLEILRQHLANTDLPITRAAKLSGFTNLAYLATLFKKRYGKPMRAWRLSESPRSSLP